MPVNYKSSGSTVGPFIPPTVTVDPVSPVNHQTWILQTTGTPMGLLMAITHTLLQLSIQTPAGIERLPIT